jgi:hypothetical protein
MVLWRVDASQQVPFDTEGVLWAFLPVCNHSRIATNAANLKRAHAPLESRSTQGQMVPAGF